MWLYVLPVADSQRSVYLLPHGRTVDHIAEEDSGGR